MEHTHIEGKGKPTKVVAPEGAPEWYLKQGKEYIISEVEEIACPERGWFFRFIAENGLIVYDTERDASHLNGGNWIVTEREQL